MIMVLGHSNMPGLHAYNLGLRQNEAGMVFYDTICPLFLNSLGYIMDRK